MIMDQKSKRITETEAAAVERSAENLSISELSRVTGVRIELLRRFINRQVGNIRAETWDKIYPHVRPYLVDPQETQTNPRIGPAYRRHPELVAMVSDQKVLLDVLDVLSPAKRQEALTLLSADVQPGAPSAYRSLSPEENKIMGVYMALPEGLKDQRLRQLIAMGIGEIKKSRREITG